MNQRDRLCEDVDWIDLAQGRVQTRAIVQHGNQPSGSVKAPVNS
jgi:hypothetical protein